MKKNPSLYYKNALNTIISLQNIQKFSKHEILIINALIETRERNNKLCLQVERLENQVRELIWGPD
jgi:hypothetical protein